MQKVISGNIWDKLADSAGGGTVRVWAAIAYVSTDEFLAFGRGDTLVCDASDTAIQTRQTSRDVLAKAAGRGAKVYHCPGLHAKVVALNDSAVIGSANLSKHSATDLVEVAVLTDHAQTVAAAKATVLSLAARSSRVNQAFLKRLMSLKLAPITRPTSEKQFEADVTPRSSRTWVISVQPVDEGDYPSEKRLVATGERKAGKKRKNACGSVNWTRYEVSDRFRREAQPPDFVIELYSDTSRSPVSVCRPMPVLLRQEEPHCARFFMESTAVHQRDSLSLREFRDLLAMAGYRRKIDRSSTLLLPTQVAEQLLILWPKRTKGRR